MQQLLDHNGAPVPTQNYAPGIPREALQALYSEILQINEASALSSRGLLDLAMDDVGWQSLGDLSGGVVDNNTRQGIVQRSRMAAMFDPLSVQTLRIWRIFTNGRGIKVKAEEESTQDALDEFWNAPRNRSVFSYQGLNENTDTLNQDGELVFAVFTGDKFGGTTVRRMNNLEITRVVTSPKDAEVTLGYTREFTTPDNDRKKLFYWDIFLPEEARGEVEIPKDFEEQENVVIHFTAANTRWQRGNPLLAPALDWSKAFRKFMNARHAIQLAMAEFVKKHDVKGGIQAVAAAVQFHKSTLGGGSGETNPPRSPGATWVNGEGSDLSTIKQETGASSAQVDGDMLLQMQGVGVGLPPHYYGSGKSAGNLSVATTMELPILKQFQAEQEIYREIYTDLILYEFEQVSVPEDKRDIEIDFPEIVIKDVPALMTGLQSAVTVAPRLGGSEAIEMFILSAFGIQDPAAVIEGLEDVEPEEEPEGGDEETQEAVQLAKGLRRLATKLKESAR